MVKVLLAGKRTDRFKGPRHATLGNYWRPFLKRSITDQCHWLMSCWDILPVGRAAKDRRFPVWEWRHSHCHLRHDARRTCSTGVRSNYGDRPLAKHSAKKTGAAGATNSAGVHKPNDATLIIKPRSVNRDNSKSTRAKRLN
jgi:hypothetical protein